MKRRHLNLDTAIPLEITPPECMSLTMGYQPILQHAEAFDDILHGRASVLSSATQEASNKPRRLEIDHMPWRPH